MPGVIDSELDRLLLRQSNNGAIGQSLQAKIVSRLFNAPVAKVEKHKTGLVTYFAHFQKELNLWSASQQSVAIETYSDFLNLVDHLKTHKDKPRHSPEVMGYFPKVQVGTVRSRTGLAGNTRAPLAKRYQSTTQEEIDNALALTVGLWIMIYMGPSDSNIFVGRSHLQWPSHSSLKETIRQNFEKVPQPPFVKGCSFPRDFNAHNLERIGGFQVKWTSSLKDHLAFDDDSTTIVLYHFASVLSLHEDSTGDDSIFPDGLVNETCRTLALLLPAFDYESKRWFCQAVKRANGLLDPSAAKQSLNSRDREIDSYEFWHHRLTPIAEAFNSVEPRGFKAWWFDRRKGVQWINFWIAVTVLVLTFLFGLVSSITGILQVYFASKSGK